MSGIRVPVNVPYFWKMVKKATNEITGVVDAGNLCAQDIFNDLTQYYLNLNLSTAKVAHESLFRVVELRWYPETETLSRERQEALIDAGFLVDHSKLTDYYNQPIVFGAVPGFYKMKSDVQDVQYLVDDLYNPVMTLQKDINFTIEPFNYLVLHENPFEADVSLEYKEYFYQAPWGEAIRIRSCRVLALSVKLGTSPVWENYGCLVYTRNIDVDIETEVEYRNKILGLFLMFYKGMTQTSLNAALNVILGLPITLSVDELVTSTYIDGITGYRIVNTDKNVYSLDVAYPLNPLIVPGKVLPEYTPLHGVVEILEAKDIEDKYYEVTDDMPWLHNITLPTSLYDAPVNSVDFLTTNRLKFYDVDNLSEVPVSERLCYDTPGVEPKLVALSSLTFASGLLTLVSGTFDGWTTPVIPVGEYYLCHTTGDLYTVGTLLKGTIMGNLEIPSPSGTLLMLDCNVTGQIGTFLDGVNITNDGGTWTTNKLIPFVHVYNYYIWKTYLRDTLFRIQLMVSGTMTIDDVLTLIDDVLPMWATYIVEVPN
jgi:hypothetical protein